MIRAFVVVAAIALGVGVALAQQDPIAARRALMKANGDEAKTGAAMDAGVFANAAQHPRDNRFFNRLRHRCRARLCRRCIQRH